MRSLLLQLGLHFVAAAGCPTPSTASTNSATATNKCTATLPVTVNVLTTFGYPSWCENLAIRSNGQILVTRLDTPEVYQVDPTGAIDPVLVTSWNASEYMGALGIAETKTDVFYVITSAFVDDDFVKTSGVNSIWQLDMSTFAVSADGAVTSAAHVTKVADVDTADFLNGMVALDDSNLLVSDVYSGVVYKVDVADGSYAIAIDDPKMKYTYAADPTTNLGVNGIKIRDSYLYWDNTAAGTFNRIKIDSKGSAVGESSTVADNVPKADDFVFRMDGTAFIAQNQEDQLSILYPGSSEATVIAGSNISTTLAGVTSGKFGRLSTDSHILYLTTSGGLALAINGTVTVAGTVSYIDTSCL